MIHPAVNGFWPLNKTNMGKSIICNFAVRLSDGNIEYITGAMSFKECLSQLLSQRQYDIDTNKKSIVNRAYIWAQTKKGRDMLRGSDYITMYIDGRKEFNIIQ